MPPQLFQVSETRSDLRPPSHIFASMFFDYAELERQIATEVPLLIVVLIVITVLTSSSSSSSSSKHKYANVLTLLFVTGG